MKKEHWINMAKFVAILAVLVDHTNGVLYSSKAVAMASYFSVSLFILLMGITSYWSYERNFGDLKNKLLNKLGYILGIYLIATVCYNLATFHAFDFQKYLESLIHFNASGPLYFILLYIQLLIISPILFYSLKICIKKYSEEKKKLLAVYTIHGGGVLIICFLSTNFSNILNVYGGGGRLLGGTYFFLFYVGMIIAENYRFLKGGFFGFLFFLLCSVCWWWFECFNQFGLDAKLPFGSGFNPPSISSSLMTILVAGTVYNLAQFLLKKGWMNKIVLIWSWLGSHTLYIFLYHRFFLDFVLPKCKFVQVNIWIKRCGYMAVMIFGSIAIEFFFNWLWLRFKEGKKIVIEMAEEKENEKRNAG